MFCFLYLITAFGLLAVGYLFGDAFWWLALLNSLQYWLFLPALLFWVEQIFTPKKSWALLLALLTIIWVILYVPVGEIYSSLQKPKNSPNQPAPEAKADSTLSVMTFNLLANNQQLEKIGQLIRQQKPDLLCLQEATPSKVQLIEKLYKHHNYPDAKEVFDLACYSNYPISNVKRLRSKNGQFQVFKLKFRGQELPVVNLHTLSLEPLDAFSAEDRQNILASFRSQKALLREILKYLEQNKFSGERALIMGDFNSTEGNEAYQLIRAEGYQDTYRAINTITPINSFTFPNNMQSIFNRSGKFIPFVRIDFIFAGPSWKVLHSAVLSQETGSDHRPVISHLQLQ